MCALTLMTDRALSLIYNIYSLTLKLIHSYIDRDLNGKQYLKKCYENNQ